jgi:hypothetical protein
MLTHIYCFLKLRAILCLIKCSWPDICLGKNALSEQVDRLTQPASIFSHSNAHIVEPLKSIVMEAEMGNMWDQKHTSFHMKVILAIVTTKCPTCCGERLMLSTQDRNLETNWLYHTYFTLNFSVMLTYQNDLYSKYGSVPSVYSTSKNNVTYRLMEYLIYWHDILHRFLRPTDITMNNGFIIICDII